MPELLYLDTARLGQMSPRARRASVDFARFASEYGCSLYLSDFLQSGFNSWPTDLQNKYPGLEDWGGVVSLKRRLQQLAQADSRSNVMVAARSAALMAFAARLLFGPCRNVLITDLTWKPYDQILRRVHPMRDRQVTKIALRRWLFRQRPSTEEIVEHFATEFRDQDCDGLFLPLVDCFGVHLPVSQIVDRIRAENELRFVVVDGAQAINHVPLGFAADYCDFLLAGCHKWLRSFSPMGVGLFGRPGTVNYIQDSLERWSKSGVLNDPLFIFANELESERPRRFGESVAVTPMIVANAAVTDALRRPANDDSVAMNREAIMSIASANNRWAEVSAGEEMSSRIIMLRSRCWQDRQRSADSLRRRFHNAGIAVSTYSRGRVRISVPDHPIKLNARQRLEAAFCHTTSAV